VTCAQMRQCVRAHWVEGLGTRKGGMAVRRKEGSTTCSGHFVALWAPQVYDPLWRHVEPITALLDSIGAWHRRRAAALACYDGVWD